MDKDQEIIKLKERRSRLTQDIAVMGQHGITGAADSRDGHEKRYNDSVAEIEKINKRLKELGSN